MDRHTRVDELANDCERFTKCAVDNLKLGGSSNTEYDG